MSNIKKFLEIFNGIIIEPKYGADIKEKIEQRKQKLETQKEYTLSEIKLEIQNFIKNSRKMMKNNEMYSADKYSCFDYMVEKIMNTSYLSDEEKDYFLQRTNNIDKIFAHKFYIYRAIHPLITYQDAIYVSNKDFIADKKYFDSKNKFFRLDKNVKNIDISAFLSNLMKDGKNIKVEKTDFITKSFEEITNKPAKTTRDVFGCRAYKLESNEFVLIYEPYCMYLDTDIVEITPDNMLLGKNKDGKILSAVMPIKNPKIKKVRLTEQELFNC